MIKKTETLEDIYQHLRQIAANFHNWKDESTVFLVLMFGKLLKK